MKLSTSLLSCVAAGPTVTCNDAGDAVRIRARLLDSDVQIDLSTLDTDPWTKVTGGYMKDFFPTAGDGEEVTLNIDDNDPSKGTYRALQIVNTVNSQGCEQKEIDGVQVCVKTGHQYTFTCNYDLSDQDLDETEFTVSGSDVADSATNTGTLKYTLTVDKTTTYKIGETVTAVITPTTSGLVHATIKSCEVRNTSKNSAVSLIGANLEPVTEVSTAISTGTGTGPLSFSWSSFKWSTSMTNNGEISPDESQDVHCSISLSKDAKPQETQWSTFERKMCHNTRALEAMPANFDDPSLEGCKSQCDNASNCNAFSFGEYQGSEYCSFHTACDKMWGADVGAGGMNSYVKQT